MYCKESEEIKCEKAVDLYTCIEMLCKKKKYACALNMKQTFVEQENKYIIITYYPVVGIAIMVVFQLNK